jgi:hypothetical protein
MGEGDGTTRLRDVISGLRRTGGRYEDLTPVQKRKWRYLVRHNQFDVEGLQSLYRYVQTDLGLKFEKLFRQSERTLDAAAEAARTQPYEEGPVLDLEEIQLDNILKTLAELDDEVKRALEGAPSDNATTGL